MLLHRGALRRGGQAIAMAGWIPLSSLRPPRSLRPRRGRPQAVSALRLQTPDLADRGQSDGAHEAAADDMVPRRLPDQPGQNRAFCAGVSVWAETDPKAVAAASPSMRRYFFME